jgi:citrate lyase subunit beta/citryl-CoA lyase
MYRSWLFVPGDSEKKIAKSQDVSPDVVILDLEDAVAPSRKPAAREVVRDYLQRSKGNRKSKLYVRVNPLQAGMALDDLAAIMPGAPDGIVQPKAGCADEVIQLGHYLDAYETQNGIAPGTTMILPVATEVPQAMFNLGSYDKVGPRLVGVTWGAEDLSAAIGAIGNKDENGDWSQPFALARSLCLFSASAAGVLALDTLYADFKDDEGLMKASRRSRRDGFSGKIAIHPAQVATINKAFSPSEEEVAHARRIVDLFAANPEAGTLSLDGAMVDMPHLVQARKTLALAGV